MPDIVANSVLPAKREPLTLRTADGLELVAELASPATAPPSATIICVHPLPTHGGMMDSHVFRKMAWRLPALAAAIAFAQGRGLPAPWLVGWSFGTDVVLKHGNVDPVAGAVLLSPPLRFSVDADLDAWAASGRALTCLVPEFDDYLQPDPARQRFARIPQCEVVGVEGAKHLWVGERYVVRVLNEVVERVLPGRTPLAAHWDGPMERWSDL